MTKPAGWIAAVIMLGLWTAHAAAAADDWTRPVEVTFDQKRCISFRAALIGQYLAVEATIEPGWHTFAMDSTLRAAEKLAGRKSLSQDMPTEIDLTNGLEVSGPWLQSSPRDFSRPELRWFSWGFVDRALFAAQVRRSGEGPGQIALRGQVCTETTCKRIDVAISVPFPPAGSKPDTANPDLKDLIQVRSK